MGWADKLRAVLGGKRGDLVNFGDGGFGALDFENGGLGLVGALIKDGAGMLLIPVPGIAKAFGGLKTNRVDYFLENFLFAF